MFQNKDMLYEMLVRNVEGRHRCLCTYYVPRQVHRMVAVRMIFSRVPGSFVGDSLLTTACCILRGTSGNWDLELDTAITQVLFRNTNQRYFTILPSFYGLFTGNYLT